MNPTILISSADEDRKYADYILRHLEPLRARSDVTLLSWRDIPPGTDTQLWRQEGLKKANVALLLLSASLFKDQFSRKEFEAVIERRQDGLQIIPILVRPCDWRSIPELNTLQALPRDGRFLSELGPAERDKVLVEIVQILAAIVDDLTKSDPGQRGSNLPPRPPPPPPPPMKKWHLPRWGALGLLIMMVLVYISWHMNSPFGVRASNDPWCTECDRRNLAGDRCGCDPQERLFRDTVCRLDTRSELQECHALVAEIANPTLRSAQLSECIRGKVTTNPIIVKQIERGPSQESLLYFRRKCIDNRDSHTERNSDKIESQDALIQSATPGSSKPLNANKVSNPVNEVRPSQETPSRTHSPQPPQEIPTHTPQGKAEYDRNHPPFVE